VFINNQALQWAPQKQTEKDSAMNIHEYQAKELMKKFGINVPRGQVAFTVDEAVAAAKTLGGPVWVVKSQIHAGGRGKGTVKEVPTQNGVKVVKSLDDVKTAAKNLLGNTLVTVQTGEHGQKVNRVYIEDGCAIAKEYYLGLLLDRATSRITIMASTEGGMDIEEVAHKTPEKIMRVSIDPATGIQPFHTRDVAYGLKLEGETNKKCQQFLTAMYKAFIELDAAIVEINPLVVTQSGDVIALDAKMNFDDNALYRHPDIQALRDESEENPIELEANKVGLNYVKLDGNIGCMVNGAGLAMATMDIVQLAGQKPANFLDVGGGANKDQITKAFKIILSDSSVEAILVNIFGGIMRCDIIADGIVAAAKEVKLDRPLIVRLAGTNVDKGKEILANSGLPIISADDLKDTAEKVKHVLDKKAA
jgi:succinyl-CoA synthetase beta subunit